jgi:hypothetical protein
MAVWGSCFVVCRHTPTLRGWTASCRNVTAVRMWARGGPEGLSCGGGCCWRPPRRSNAPDTVRLARPGGPAALRRNRSGFFIRLSVLGWFIVAIGACDSWNDAHFRSDRGRAAGLDSAPHSGQRVVFPVHRAHFAIGGDEPILPEAELGVVLGGRISPDGQAVALLDAVDPFIKMYFPADGRLLAFGNRGSGPGEIRDPTAIAISNEAVLVADRELGRLTLFSHAGSALWTATYPHLVLAAVAHCNGWLLYGPHLGRSETAPWLHYIAPLPQGQYTQLSLLEDSVPTSVGVGKFANMVRGADGAVLRHETGGTSRVIERFCSGAIRTIASSEGGDKEPAYMHQANAPAVGIGHVSSLLTIADLVLHGGVRTRIQIVGGESVHTLFLDKPYILLDSDATDGMLFFTDDPLPIVYLVPHAWMDGGLEN